MPPFRIRVRTTLSLSRPYTHTSLYRQDSPFPITATCPPSTCACTPMPTALDIDHKRPLANTVVPYSQHVLIPTGQIDWTSRIEDEGCTNSTWGRLTAYLKHEVGPKGSAYDSNNPMLISASSFSPSPSTQPASEPTSDGKQGKPTSSLLLFPSFRHYANLSLISSTLPTLLPTIRSSVSLNPPADSTSPSLPYTPIRTPTILVCSHATRDSRCGTLGPLLQSEFTRQVAHLGLRANTSTFISQPRDSTSDQPVNVNVGCISHVGGHRWAGNVIVYLPPADKTENALAGTGVWYGRVEPRHVEGIIRETVLGGRVIRELWRGGVGRDGRMMRI